MTNLTPQPASWHHQMGARNLLERMLLKQYCCRFEKIYFHEFLSKVNQ